MQLPDNLLAARGTVLSRDGTPISYRLLGDGPPLVICHGSFTVAQDWQAFAERMATTRTVYLYDRRGRGENPYTTADFAIDAEIDDLAAIVGRAGPDAAVLGHSFGGGCALAFAAREGFAGPLILYEPRHGSRGPVSRGRIADLDAIVATGDRDAAAAFVMTDIIGMPETALARFRESPMWGVMLQTVHAFPNELRLLDSFVWRLGDLDRIKSALWLLVGDQSPMLPDDLSPDEALRALLPKLRTVSIPGQAHFAYLSAPSLLAEIVRDCLVHNKP